MLFENEVMVRSERREKNIQRHQRMYVCCMLFEVEFVKKRGKGLLTTRGEEGDQQLQPDCINSSTN